MDKESNYVTKDSGERVNFPSGMRRDVDTGKPRYDLIPIPPLTRLAELYARGAEKYGDENWQLANSDRELLRFRASFLRHAYQWMAGDYDEDHAIAAVWNIFAYLTIEDKLRRGANVAEKETASMALDDLVASLPPDEGRYYVHYDEEDQETPQP